MSKYTSISIKVPDVNRVFIKGKYKYSDPATLKANKTVLSKITKDYGALILKWGLEFEVDPSIITSFIATESNNTNSPPNDFDATGLMQMTPNTVWEILSKWKSKVGSLLSPTAISFFNKAIPSSKNYNPNNLPTPAVKSEIRLALQKNSEFNIAIGTANIRWLLEAFKENGIADINKVMVSYNAGYYAMRTKVTGNPTTEQLVLNKKIPLESRGYLLKMLGVNGFIQLYENK